MRDDTTDPRDIREMRDANHIWLRQSVTFTVNGQTRTLEMALPLRPGAMPDEVESLLDEADAGMRRLSRRLDAHLAEVTGATPLALPASAPTSTPASTPAAPPTAQPARQTAQPVAQPARAAAAAPQLAAQAGVAERQPAPAASQPRNPTPSAPVSGAPDLTRAEFIAALAAIDLDARTAMERLQVRTLNGLNLREALESLRRQVARDGSAPAAPAASMEAPAEVEDEQERLPTPIGVARFEEEDEESEEDGGLDFELSYPDPDDLPSDEDFAGEEAFAPMEDAAPPTRRPAATAPLSDVPELDDLLGAPPAAPSSAPQPTARSAAKPTAKAPSKPAAPAAPAEDPAIARAREVIARLRAAHGGGQPTEHQRNAYAHIVIDQIGETKAAGVARAVWRLTPERLGPEQLDELIRWGKEDAFAEEVESALELLREEYRSEQQARRAGGAAPGAPANPPAEPAPDAAPASAQAASAARPAVRGGRQAPQRAPRDGAPGGD